MRNGLPDIMLQFLGGIGDELLLTAVAHELKKRNPDLRIWQVSHSAELLYHNPDYSKVFNWNYWPLRYSQMLNGRRCHLSYSEQIIPGESEKPPGRHIIAELCRKAGIKGEISIRPYYYFTEEDGQTKRFSSRQFCIQSIGNYTHETWMKNKLWYHDRFQQVVDEIRSRYPDVEVIQVGIEKDPPLERVIDLRGKTTLRQTATILRQSDCFIGTQGFLAHLARAVDCRSVIIYGGREHSYQTGYICNENLNSFIECAPCWRWNGCDHGRKCMEIIKPKDVLQAVQRVLNKKSISIEMEITNIE